MAHKFRLVFVVLAMLLVSIIMYVFFHESGHALVAVLCGANNIKISIISAHTQWTGGRFTVITQALCDAAGAALPVCVSCAAMIFYSKSCRSLVYHMVYVCFFIAATSSVTAWVWLPACSLSAPLPDQTDDIARFLNVSGISPVMVSLTGVIIILFCIFIAVRKQLFHTLIQLVKDIKNGEIEMFVSNKSMLEAGIAVLIAIFITILFEFVFLELPDIMAKPIISFAITDEVPETVTYRTFDIQQENVYHFRTQIDAEGILVVVGIWDESQELVFQNIIYDQIDSNSTFDLSPGTYTLSVTYLADADIFDQYCSEMGYRFEDWETEKFASVYEQEKQLSRLFIELKE